MMILDLSTRKRKHPESPDCSTYPIPERTPNRDESPTMYYHAHPNSPTEFLEHSNSSDHVTTSSEKVKPIEAFPNEPLSFTRQLDVENGELIAMESSTPYTQTRWVLSQMQVGTDGFNVQMGTKQLQSTKKEDTSSLPKLNTRSFIALSKYYTQFEEVPSQGPLGYKNINENLNYNQLQKEYGGKCCLGNDRKNCEAVERSLHIRSPHYSSDCSENFNSSYSSTSTFPKEKTRLSKGQSKYPVHLAKEELPINSTTFHTQYRDEVEESRTNMYRSQLDSLRNEDSICLESSEKSDEASEETLGSSSNGSWEYSKNRNSEMPISSFPKLKTRPFKAFPKDLLSGLVTNNEAVVPNDSATSYSQFRDRILSQVEANHNASNENMRRNQLKTSDSEDPSYLEKRKKNNEAAKKSRDARKAKEDEIAIRCAILEQENMELRNRLYIVDSYVRQLGDCFRYT